MTITKDIQILLKWLEIREQCGHSFPKTLVELKNDIDHSSLLKRLLEGKDPLELPPPRSHSYPWYELIEDGCANLFELFEINSNSQTIPTGMYSLNDDKRLVINQDPRWKIIEKKNEKEWIVIHENMLKTKWRVWHNGYKIPTSILSNSKMIDDWQIKKLQ